MPLRAVVTIIPGGSDPSNNTSMAGLLELDLQVVIIGQLRLVVE